MVRTVNAEVAVTIIVGFLLMVSGVYLNFQNLDLAQRKYVEADALNGNEIFYGLVQVIGMAIMFVGATRGLMRRSDVMANKFVNIMDVFTSLIKKEMEVIDDHDRRRHLAEIEEKGEKFKKELSGLRRI